VRWVFVAYANTQIGLDKIAQQLEDRGTLTKSGKKLWRRSFLKAMLTKETYLGIKYFNTMRCVREYANPVYGIARSTKKMVPQTRENWIGVEVPAIISRELFERVQKRLANNRARFRNPRQVQLLSTLVRCGSCGGSVYAYRGWLRRSARARSASPTQRHTSATGASGPGCTRRTRRSIAAAIPR
jgi:site-specific DNA recombinase